MPEGLTVRISTEHLARASGDISKKISDLRTAFDKMTEVMNRTGGYWLGEAGEAHRRVYDQLKPHQEEVLKRLQEQVRDLTQIAGIWETAEQEVKEMDLSLPDDVIV